MAVNLFLSGKLNYTEIAEVIREATELHSPISNPDVYQALAASNWAKQQVANLVK